MKVYVDGVEQSYDLATLNNLAKESTFEIPTSFQMIGIRCENLGGDYGILASVEDTEGNDFLVTDQTWRCSKNELNDDWLQNEFDDSTWEIATEKGHSVNSIPGDISHSAKWIWTKDVTTQGGVTANCRIRRHLSKY